MARSAWTRADETGADDHYPRSRPQCFPEGERVVEAAQRVHIRQAWHTEQLTGPSHRWR